MGRTSLSAIARLGRLYGAPLAHALGFRRGKTPTKAMLSELLRALDPHAFEAALSRWICSRLAAAPEHLSLDGKTLKGSRDGSVPGQHLVAVYAPAVEAVLAQVRVDAKTNEHKAALHLLGLIPLAGKVVVGDAMFCQRDLAEQVIQAGGHYVLVVKDNQPGLQTDVAAGFGYEASQRSIAAAFSPRHRAAPGTPGQHDGERAWPGREAHPADDHDPDAAPALARVGSGV
jgi:predicted transposase YbfD/YdcC